MTRARSATLLAGCLAALVVPPLFARAGPGDAGTTRPMRESYVLHCSGCHRSDGSGVDGFAPDLRRIGPLLRTQAGRDYLVRVPGVAQAPASDRELAALLNWVLAEIAETPPDRPYTASEVAALRAKPLRDPLAARRALSARPQ
jgi:mono/diheme cytochrome c family protein